MDFNDKIFETTKFIQKYRKRDCLWNLKAKDYKNIVQKNRAYEELGAIFKTPVSVVKKKINTLRSNFLKEEKRINASKASGAGVDELCESRLYWFEDMKFIRDLAVPRTTKSNDYTDIYLDNSTDSLIEYCTSSQFPPLGNSEEDEEILEIPSSKAPQILELPQIRETPKIIESSTSSTSFTKQTQSILNRKSSFKKIKKHAYRAESPTQLNTALAAITNFYNKESDEIHNWCVLLESQVRSLPILDSFQIMQQVNDIVLKKTN